ncbi:FtsX-like permease family protein [Clavibacter sp. VKM Ac-2872]|uniref:ABC transporter permease n=1 Tax=Clavibacter sp. VKM Ac-2872 TaxID=2783812 RepID=UPI00188A6AE1|nr:FtsX-like permease family protein [Clavibacter sp. VKM Ac-2872]MBF4625792.1 FtsX-like permease family protein [Clavibacter sp. VKM Ac-2872]
MRSLRTFSPTIIVAALGTLFGSVLVIVPGLLRSVMRLEPGSADDVEVRLQILGMVFLGIALYVGTIVTANTCATLIAGQTRVLALQRLIGASGASLRRHITRTGIVVGLLGAIIGTVVGVSVSVLGVGALVHAKVMPADVTYYFWPWQLVIPIVAVVITTWGAFRTGSRAVLTVAPIDALSAVVETGYGEAKVRMARKVWMVLLFAVGAAFMIWSAQSPADHSEYALPALLGVMCAATGGIVGSGLLIPPVLRVVGMIGRRDPVVLLAGRNAMRSPIRAARATLGLVIGVSLLVAFSVGLQTLQVVLETHYAQEGWTPEDQERVKQMFVIMNIIVMILVGFSGVVAAAGVINALALNVMQRRRELGLLRVLGLTGSQVRRMIVCEAVQMVVTAVVSGLALGTLFGWDVMRAAVGPGGGVPPVLSPTLIAVVSVGALVIAVAASIVPVRQAMRVSPTEALAGE